MATRPISVPGAEGADIAPPIRAISNSDLKAALGEGWDDFTAMRGDIIFAGLLYPLIGIVAGTAIIGGALLPLLFPILAGFGMLGPVAALGFYELARRREQGLTSNWSHFLDFRKRPSAREIDYVVLLLVGIFALWLLTAGLLYIALWGDAVPASAEVFLTRLFTTMEGWALIVIGNLIGAGFATLVLAVSAVSLPMLVDRDMSAAEAVRISTQAFRENKKVMIRWGLMVLALLIVGSIPLFIGLAVVLPWLGYSTWHLYRRIVVDGPAPAAAGTA